MKAVGHLGSVSDRGSQPEGAHAVGRGEDGKTVRLQTPECVVLAESGEFGGQRGQAALVESHRVQLFKCRFCLVAESDAPGRHMLGLRRRAHIDRNAGVGTHSNKGANLGKRRDIDM